MPSPRNLLARCIIAAGSLPSGVLLFRILYWAQHAKIERDGHTWIVRSRTDWLEDTALTLKQYKDALHSLRVNQMIETRQGKFGPKVITYLRLRERGQMVQNGEEPGSLEGPPESALQGPPELALEGPPYSKGDKVKEIESSDYVFATGAGDGEIDKGPELGYSVPVKEDKTMPTVKELLTAGGKFSKPKSLAKASTASEHQSVMTAWRSAVAASFGGYQPPYTQKQQGQFKLFAKACPNGQGPSVASKIVEDWAEFVGKVKAEAGVQNTPNSPNIDFALKHVGVAVNFAVKQEPPVKKTVATSKKTATTQPVQLTAQGKPEQKATKAEILAILAGGSKE